MPSRSHLLETGMHSGQLVFAQVMTYLPLKAFSRMVKARRAQHKVKHFSCLDQFLALAFAQLTGRESLRDIEINLRVQRQHFYHLGFRCKTISRNTLANANSVRPWQVFADLAHHLIGVARSLYANDATSTELKSLMGATVYALDSTTIDLCLSLFSWAPFRATKAAVKLDTLMDLRGSTPSFIHISDGKMHDVKVLDILVNQGYIEIGAFYVMDKAYVDFARLHQLHTARAFFVTRAKRNMRCVVVREFPVTINTGLISDQHIQLSGCKSHKRYSESIRRVTYTDPETGKTLVFLTNNTTLPAVDHLRALLTALAGRVVLQVDQTTPAHQSVFWNNRERGEDANLDSHRHLRVDRHRQKAVEIGSFFVRNSQSAGLEHV